MTVLRMYSDVFGFCRISVDTAALFVGIQISQGSPWAATGLPVFLLKLVFAVPPATTAPATFAQLLPAPSIFTFSAPNASLCGAVSGSTV